jgi:mannosyl-3-phosphoglycerate phosphatase
MKKDSINKGVDTPFIVIFTDLDGTLLDHYTYKWESAKPALDTCKHHQIPVIMVSSKTRAELEILQEQMELFSPFISENGGGIFFPKNMNQVPPGTIIADHLYKWEMGTPYESLIRSLEAIRNELGLPIRGFSEMALGEISQLTGLDLDGSRLAAAREYDEPFIILDRQDIDMEALQQAAQKRGLQITTGGRFFHIHGKNDKGTSVKKLISWYGQSHPLLFTIALGDSPNDFSMLKQVDQPVLVRSQQNFPRIGEEIPGLKVTGDMGPKGWKMAVLDILNEKIWGGIFGNV